jgi:hypothetical protein
MRLIPSPEEAREEGRDWPIFAQTMIGRRRLDQLQDAVEAVIAEDVPGDLIETGVWRGGASILMRAVLAAHDVDDRTVYVADSFRGLPEPNAERYPADAGSTFHIAEQLAIPREEVEANFRRYGMLDDQVRFLEGWFSETLPGVADRTWSVIRLDGDMYESTMDALTNLYPGLSPGGFLIVDDYSIDSCREAVHDYREANGITGEIEKIDWTGVFWRKDRG